MKIFYSLLIILFLVCFVYADNYVNNVENSALDTISKVSYYSNVKDKEYLYHHFVRLDSGMVYDSVKVYHSVLRLEELDDIKSVRLIEYQTHSGLELNYFIEEHRNIVHYPYGSFLQKPDTVLNQAYATYKLSLVNPFYMNNSFFVEVTHSLPFGFTNVPVIVKGMPYESYAIGYTNEYFTRLLFISSIYADYIYLSSASILHRDEQTMSVAYRFGKRFDFHKMYGEAAFFDRKTYKENSSVFINHSQYPRLGIRYVYEKKSSENLYQDKEMVDAALYKYGVGTIDPLELDFYKIFTQGVLVKTIHDFKMLFHGYAAWMLDINKDSEEQYLFAGGLKTNRGYNKNSIPFVDDGMNKMVVGSTHYRGLQSEVDYFLFRLGPIDNFYLNHLSSFYSAAVWFDYTVTESGDRKMNSYYSYGLGLRAYANKINTYWSLDYSIDKKDNPLLSLSYGLNF